MHNTSRSDLADTSGQTYPTPEKTGSLRIVSGGLNNLNLISTDGTAYTFDAANGVLSRSSPTTAVATAISTPVPLGGASAP